MSEEQAKRKKDESKDFKEELTEDELKGLSGGGVVYNKDTGEMSFDERNADNNWGLGAVRK